MPMYNLTRINKIIVDSQEYSKAYLGSELIWEGIKLAGQTDKNYLLNSNVIKNYQAVTYDLSHQVLIGRTYTFSMAGWHGGSDWDSNFGIYGVIISTEILLGEAVNIPGSNIYTVTFSDPDFTYTKVRVKSMKTSNNFNYQINWAVLVEGTETHTEYLEPEEIIETIRETVTEPIPYSTTFYDDPNRNVGTNVVTTLGVDGVRTIVWDVTYRNGSEIGRVKVSDSVTTQPIARRIARGTKPVGTLISSSTLYGPGAISDHSIQKSYTGIYYVALTEPLIAGKLYRIEVTRPGSTGAILFTRLLSVRLNVQSSPNILERTFTSAQADANRVYAENASAIKVYRMD